MYKYVWRRRGTLVSCITSVRALAVVPVDKTKRRSTRPLTLALVQKIIGADTGAYICV